MDLKNLIQKNIVAIDIVGLIFSIFLLGGIYLVVPSKLSDDILISPIKTVVKDKSSLVENQGSKRLPIAKRREVIGFLPSWMVAQNVRVDSEKLSQIIYFGLGVNSNGEIVQYKEDQNPTHEWNYFTSDYFAYIKREARKNKTKILLAFKMFDNENIDNLISNSSSTNFFIKNVLAILKKYDLDGVNLDFEYFTDSPFPTVRHLSGFLNNLSQALKKDNPDYTISIDINAIVALSDKAYDMVKIGEIVDQVILMAYDYKTSASKTAGPVAPLYGEINEHSINGSINSLVGRVPMDKIILGIPFYGYEWETLNKNHKSTTVENSGALATYKRVKELLSNRKDIIVNWDQKAMSPWLVYEQSGAIKQIYYEDEKSIAAKMDYVKENNLGGIAIWTLGYEGKDNNLWSVIVKNMQLTP